MLVYLVSEDSHTHSLCREVLTELLGPGHTLCCLPAPLPDFDADLFLWDILPDPAWCAGIKTEENWRHFFFTDRSGIEQIRRAVPVCNPNIVLKPVARAALLAFLANACERPSVAREGLADAAPVDRDILQCLMQTNLKLQEYDHERTNFLARAIHDFRAPLTAITGYCDLLLGQDLGNLTDEQREVIERMHRSAKKLSRMANAMFQLSISARIETAVDIGPGEIRECIDQAVHEILPAAQEKRVSINWETLPVPEPLYFDRIKIEQVIVNLLDNACRFVPRGGTIDIRGYPYQWDDCGGNPNGAGGSGRWNDRAARANSYRLDIRDTGPGIPAAHLTTLFEEYTSYGGGTDRSGGGLGLAICRMILKQHKGRIWAESSPSGAVFSFLLPFHRNTVSHQHVFHAAAVREL